MVGGHEYDAEDLTIARELAQRAGYAVDNARMFEATQHVARTLQASLLPRTLPAMAGVEIVARYRAAGEGYEVGGDFYDAFEIAPGSWGVVIGDVCGKGAEAAALTALARYTIRAAAIQNHGDPAITLRALNEALRREHGAATPFLTVAYIVLTRADNGFDAVAAAAGHPPPLILRADGSGETLRTSGPLIGISADIDVRPCATALDPGDVLVLYTDGLTDAHAPKRILDEHDLLRLLTSAPERGPERLADRLEQSALAEGPPRDDLALVVLEVGAGSLLPEELPAYAIKRRA
jgi:serine phosphatase RsbU (regulator of sigma subunit)